MVIDVVARPQNSHEADFNFTFDSGGVIKILVIDLGDVAAEAVFIAVRGKVDFGEYLPVMNNHRRPRIDPFQPSPRTQPISQPSIARR